MSGPSTILVVDDEDCVAMKLADIRDDAGCGACQSLCDRHPARPYRGAASLTSDRAAVECGLSMEHRYAAPHHVAVCVGTANDRTP
jgi:hypothetical protein